MSRYPPEADEAQRRHYNDGHMASPSDDYDLPLVNYPPQRSSYQQPYQSSLPPSEANLFVTRPSTVPTTGGVPGLSAMPLENYLWQRPASDAPSTSHPPSVLSMFDLREEQVHERDIPLLRILDDGGDVPSIVDDTGSESIVRQEGISKTRRRRTLKRVGYLFYFFFRSFVSLSCV